MLNYAFNRRGFGVAPILYMLGLIGITAGVLFSNYSQSIRGNISTMNALGVKNDLESAATTLAATSKLNNNGTILCPPNLDGASDMSAAPADCPTSLPLSLAPIPASEDTRLPSTLSGVEVGSYVASSGSPKNVGILKAAAGLRQLDPWGHYYIVCRWDNAAASADPAFQIISAGPSGILATVCGASAASGNYAKLVNAADAVNRSSVWQVTALGTTTQASYSASGVSVDSEGNLIVPGNLTLSGTGKTVTFVDTDISLTKGDLTLHNGTLTAPTALITGTLTAGTVLASAETVSGALTAGTLSVAGSVFTVDASGNVETSGTLKAGATTAKSLTTEGAVHVASAVGSGGVSVSYLTVGAPAASVYPFSVDQAGNIYGAGAANVGSLTAGSATLGATSASSLNTTSIVDSGSLTAGTTQVNGDATITGNLTVTGTINGETSADLSKATGQLNLETQVTGTLPIAHGGTGGTSAAGALDNLFAAGGNGTALPTTRLPLMFAGAPGGPYNQFYVDQYGRITAYANASSGNAISDGDGDSVTVDLNTIVFKINSVTKGIWNATGLTVGSSSLARSVLDTGYDTGALIVPVGTTGQEPSSPYVGMIRYNTSLNAFEGYAGSPAEWKTFSMGGAVNGSFDGVCGSDNGTTTLTATPTHLCKSGIASAITGTGNPTWTWTCTGIGSGGNASCSATALRADATCGTSNKAIFSAAPTTGLCATGTQTAVTDRYNEWTWNCIGTGGGASVFCYAYPNGTCNPTDNNMVIASEPTQADACSTGMFKNLATTTTTITTWTWTCAGNGGGTSENCTASQVANGACGSANGTVVTTMPTGAELCSSGTATAVTGTAGTTALTWNCNPNGVGTSENCKAWAPPEAFSFTDVTGAIPGASVTSNAVTLSGGFENASATCAGSCTDIVKNGTSCGGTSCNGFKSGDTIAITATASSTALTSVTATATVGSRTSGTWTVTTQGGKPNAFAFTNQTGILPGATVQSDAVTLSGSFASLGATCSATNAGCLVSKNGGEWVSSIASGINPGDTIAVRQVSSSTASGNVATTATVSVGSSAGGYTTSSAWSVTTAYFTTKDSLLSNATTLKGLFSGLTATCSTNCAGISVGGGAFSTSVGGVSAGSTLQIMMLHAGVPGATETVSVNIGPYTVSWLVVPTAYTQNVSGTCYTTVTSYINETNPYGASITINYVMVGAGGGGGCWSADNGSGSAGGGGSSAASNNGTAFAYAAGGAGGRVGTAGSAGTASSGSYTLSASSVLTVYVGGGGGGANGSGGGGGSGYFGGGGGGSGATYSGSTAGNGGSNAGGSGGTGTLAAGSAGGFNYGGEGAVFYGKLGGTGGNGPTGGTSRGTSGAYGGGGGGYGGGGAAVDTINGGGSSGTNGLPYSSQVGGTGANTWYASTTLPAAAGKGTDIASGGNAGLVIFYYTPISGRCLF